MRYLTIRVIVALLTFLLGVAVSMVWLTNRSPVRDIPVTMDVAPPVQEKRGRQVSIPKATWEPIFFESINERANIAKLPSLRTVTLSEGDLEVRVWGGFGLTALEGIVLKLAAGQWSALHLDGIHPRLTKSKYQRALGVPKSGWDACWQRLIDAGLLTLPDDSELEGWKLITDGFSYVVEINVNNSYRTYRYGNPAWQDFAEAKQMLKIGEIIAEEFGVPEFKIEE